MRPIQNFSLQTWAENEKDFRRVVGQRFLPTGWTGLPGMKAPALWINMLMEFEGNVGNCVKMDENRVRMDENWVKMDENHENG